jgi:hypothetical protein
MTDAVQKRGYALNQSNEKLAREAGLVSADWYQSPIPRANFSFD